MGMMNGTDISDAALPPHCVYSGVTSVCCCAFYQHTADTAYTPSPCALCVMVRSCVCVAAVGPAILMSLSTTRSTPVLILAHGGIHVDLPA